MENFFSENGATEQKYADNPNICNSYRVSQWPATKRYKLRQQITRVKCNEGNG